MALRGLGRPDHFPEVGSMRQPIWPPGVTGSISHDAGVASAAVAHTSVLPGLGIDIERAGTLEGNVAAQILSESELDSWTRAAQADAEVTTMLVFSYKEAIFKCVYPLTDVFLDFRDVLIEPPGSAPTARCVDPANPCAKLVARTTGRVGRFGEQIVAVCWLEKKG